MTLRTTTSPTYLSPGSWLGVIGGGQLGRMFCQAAQAMGYRVAVLDPDPHCPAGPVADSLVCGEYHDTQALAQLADRCAAVTIEFENVPAASLEWLASRRPLAPAPTAVAVAQDRIVEKASLQRLGASVVPYVPVEAERDIRQAPDHCFPGVLKTARLGYDGKGQRRVSNRDEALAAFREMGSPPCVLEAFVNDLALEVSVVIARNAAGTVVNLPVSHNEHRSGILFHCSTPVAAPAELAATLELAPQVARQLAEGLNYVGVLCVEFFITAQGQLLVNEIAPRPHNSGHYSLDSCSVSQFELQARVLAGLPLTAPELLAPAVMINVLGDQWFDAQQTSREPDWASVLAIPGTRLHLYGKHEPRRGRKMGHVTCVASTPKQVQARAQAVLQALQMSWESPW